ncbi:hypothetical protein TCDM_08930 [Trypanosoma cruzi Dm28c]|uniref:Uncharacterized protein n=1 Tax=Trypanosoma cruzi Dm28c TaxID=1416333 RepID=V5BFP0_TRYCR|nr:hypothetical protein TCDM_08930 [Trypanosoma cruzi Dm28c]
MLHKCTSFFSRILSCMEMTCNRTRKKKGKRRAAQPLKHTRVLYKTLLGEERNADTSAHNPNGHPQSCVVVYFSLFGPRCIPLRVSPVSPTAVGCQFPAQTHLRTQQRGSPMTTPRPYLLDISWTKHLSPQATPHKKRAQCAAELWGQSSHHHHPDQDASPICHHTLEMAQRFFPLLHCFGHHSRHLAPSHDRAAPMPATAQPAASYSCPSQSSYRHASETDPRPSRRCSQRHSCSVRHAPTPCCIVAHSRPSSSHAQGSQTNGLRASVHRLGAAAASWPPSTRRCCSQPQTTGEESVALAGASRHPSSGAARHPGFS